MMRRGFWVAVGAVLGITGYRRAGQLARAVAPRRRPGAPLVRVELGWRRREAAGNHLAPGRGVPPGGPGTGRGAAAFLRDVRAGMAEYLEQRGAAPRASAGAQLASGPGAPMDAGQARRRRPAAAALSGRAPRPDDAKDGQ